MLVEVGVSSGLQDEMHSFSGKGGLSNMSEGYIALNLAAQTFCPLKSGVTPVYLN